MLIVSLFLQMYSVIEENNTLNKMYQDAKEELQALKSQSEEQKEKEISISGKMENLISEVTIILLCIL